MRLSHLDVGHSYLPGGRGNQNHLEEDLAVKGDGLAQDLLVDEELHEPEHIHAQLILSGVIDVGRNDLKNVLEPFNQGGL